MEGSITTVDLETMSDIEVVQYARSLWDEFGAAIPEPVKASFEPAFHELAARVERASQEPEPE
jgi:hypothetical protein